MKIRRLLYTKSARILINGLWKDNPVSCMVLGICSALAITNRIQNALAMGAGVTFVLMVSGFTVSALRKIIPPRVRMITYMIVISSFVLVVDRWLQAFYPDISKSMGPYVALIITNCIIMGRAEAFAINNGVVHSVIDGFACGAGYSYTLLIIASFREFLSSGTLLGVRAAPGWWTDWVVMAMAPGAFFLFSVYIWIARSLNKGRAAAGK